MANRCYLFSSFRYLAGVQLDRDLALVAEQFQQGAACFERFVEVMDIEPDITDCSSAYSFEPVAGEITINNLSFKYSASTDWVLRDISLKVPAHSTVAIVGESGAGKSTIASLIPRFYEAQEGRIYDLGR